MVKIGGIVDMKSKTHAVSDRTLQKYWRIAVLKKNHNTCVICGKIKPDSELECHHVIRRNHRVTRHDVKNGVPVCTGDCHRMAHTEKGKAEADLQDLLDQVDQMQWVLLEEEALQVYNGKNSTNIN